MPKLPRNAFLILLATLGFGLAACENTIRGAGADLEETGEAVEDVVQ